MKTSSWRLIGRAFVLGVCIAVPAAAAIAAVVAETGRVAGVLSALLGGGVGYAVAVGGGALPVAVRRLIAVAAATVGVAAWAYIAARQDLGITRAPLLLPSNTLVAAVAEDVRGDGWIVLFWLLALVVAGQTAAPDPPAATTTAGTQPAISAPDAALHGRWPGRRIWPVAAGSLLLGLTAVTFLAHAQVESGTEDPIAHLVAGQCFDDSSLDVVACQKPHEDEVYYRFTLPPGSFPGDRSVEHTANVICDAHLAAYAGTSDALFDWPYTPDQFQWAAGDRVALCALSRLDNAKTTGSARKSH